MKIVSESLFFDWDNGNIDKNYNKHNVTNRESEEVFINEPKFIFKDESHSLDETRYGIFGSTNNGRLLSLVFIMRSEKIRIITARDMSRKERRVYEKNKENTQI